MTIPVGDEDLFHWFHCLGSIRLKVHVSLFFEKGTTMFFPYANKLFPLLLFIIIIIINNFLFVAIIIIIIIEQVWKELPPASQQMTCPWELYARKVNVGDNELGDNVPAGLVAGWKLPNAGDSDSNRVNELSLLASAHKVVLATNDVSYQLFCRWVKLFIMPCRILCIIIMSNKWIIYFIFLYPLIRRIK